MKMQQQDQENGVTPKKHWKALTQGTTVNSSSTNSPSVASRSAAFENNAKDEQKVKNTVLKNISNKNDLTNQPSLAYHTVFSHLHARNCCVTAKRIGRCEHTCTHLIPVNYVISNL